MTRTEQGALIGGVAEAVLGKSTGDHHDKRLLSGAVLGGLVGAGIGSQLYGSARGSVTPELAK